MNDYHKEIDISKEKLSTIEKLKQITIGSNKEIDDEVVTNKISKIIDFVNYYEKNHLNTMLYIGKL